jgi:hypothetical protein
MNTDTTPAEPMSPRDQALLNTLEALATASSSAPRRRWTPVRTVVAALVAFTLAGAGAGVLTAGALVHTSEAVITPLESTMQTFGLYTLEDSHIVGTAQFFTGSGTTTVKVGERPSGSVSLVVGFWCLSAGRSSLTLDGHDLFLGTTNGLDQRDCAAPASQPESDAVVQHLYGALRDPSLTVAGTGRFAVWAAWISQPQMATPSAAQRAETADGVVTRDEYLAAWSRLQGCMAQAGYPLGQVPETELVLQFGTSSSGEIAFDFSCYPREFQDVDTLWQGQVGTRGDACLTAHGDPLPTGELMENALKAANLTPEECGID